MPFKRFGGEVWKARSAKGLRSVVWPAEQGAEMDLNDMSAGELLAHAVSAGLKVSGDGGRLVVRGPCGGEGLGRVLVARKADILPLLAADANPSDGAGVWDAAR